MPNNPAVEEKQTVDTEQCIREKEDTSYILTIAFVSAILAIWGVSYVNILALEKTASIYLYLSIAALFLGMGAYISNNTFPFSVLGFPKLKDIPLPLVAGTTYGFLFVLVAGGILAFTRIFSVPSPFTELNPVALYILYGFASPGAEEIFARSTILPILVRSSRSVATGVIIDSAIFMALHYLTFGGNIVMLTTAFIFSIGLCLLTLYFKSATPAISAHTTYNIVMIYFFLLPVL